MKYYKRLGIHLRLALLVGVGAVFSQDTTRLTNSLYPMSYCLSGSPDQHATMISDGGGAGEFYTGGTAGIPNIVQAMVNKSLGVMSVYKPLNATDWPEIISNLSGTGAQLAVYISKSAYSDDNTVINEMKALAVLAAQEGLTICIYPHAGFYIESTSGALDLAKKVNMANVGINFNLPHALRYHNNNNINFDSSMDAVLPEAMPYIFGMSINGADSDGQNWIQVLGQGTFDTFGLMSKFVDLGFTGPVALQCYGVAGDKQSNLDAAMTEWESWKTKLPAQVLVQFSEIRQTIFEFKQNQIILSIDDPQNISIKLFGINGEMMWNKYFFEKGIKKFPVQLPKGVYQGIVSINDEIYYHKKILIP